METFYKEKSHPLLNLTCDDTIVNKATVYISFAYADNFIELVDALESYLEKNHPLNLSAKETQNHGILVIGDLGGCIVAPSQTALYITWIQYRITTKNIIYTVISFIPSSSKKLNIIKVY